MEKSNYYMYDIHILYLWKLFLFTCKSFISSANHLKYEFVIFIIQ